MPLHLAADTLGSMLAGSGTRRRQAQVLRSLHRAQNLSAKVHQLQLSGQHVMVDEESVCQQCNRPLGVDDGYNRQPIMTAWPSSTWA
ncbi:Vps39_2 domain-containing protein, partial [Haematococcus lacustris]